MSSWKKAAKANQKVHRERPTPKSRSRYGRLERHGDYKQRAQHHHDHENTLKLLRKRALDKNPDEFYHHMIASKIKKGEHHEIEKVDENTPEQLKLMETQDLRYINMKRTIESNKIRRMQSQLHMIDIAESVPNTHTFFVDSEKEKEQFDIVQRLETHPSLLNNRTNRLKMCDLEKINLKDIDNQVLNKLKVQRDKQYKELAKRVERERELTVIQQKMEIKRCLLDKKVQNPKHIKAGSKNSAPVYKWKYERKK